MLNSHSLVMAFLLVDNVDANRYEEVVYRAKVIYKKMRKRHIFISTQENCVTALLLAISYNDANEAIEEVEKCYNTLKKFLLGSVQLYRLSHFITLMNGEVKDKCNRFIQMYKYLKSIGVNYSIIEGIDVYGIFVNLDKEPRTIIDEIIDVDNFLLRQRGIQYNKIDKKIRLSFAAILVASIEYLQECFYI